MEAKSERLIMRSHIEICDGHLIFPEIEKGVDILKNKSNVPEDGGFIFYNENDEQICHIGIETKRKTLEVSYGTQAEYRGNGYMKEALNFLLKRFITENIKDDVYALICKNPESQHILEINSFRKESPYGNNGFWFVFDRELYKEN